MKGRLRENNRLVEEICTDLNADESVWMRGI